MNAPAVPDIAQLQELPLPVPPFSYVPQTWGWWLLLAVLVLASVAWVLRSRRRWRRERYRHEALACFDQLAQGAADPQRRLQALRELPVLLKRVGLSMPDAPPVATLAGAQWQAFLVARAKAPLPADFAARLHTLSYAPANDVLAIPQPQISTLLALSRQWIETHHVAV
ncbi:DUF4381 domain-containing protein [Pseudomonas putida]|uniref:DUF4381 domain-containing protein n=1 Tax=Pseudomonas putida TaxID=303 RepID=UPI0009A2597A|nr:DUF4381 domain-containing protein [Pseudomonas putida]